MHLLLTGADGFIGSHLASGLRAAGHQLLCAVYGREPHPGELRVDLTDPQALRHLPGGIDVVVNASGVVDPGVGSRRMFAVNLHGTRHLLDWARAQGVRHFVQLSSVSVYGPLVVGEQRSELAPRLGLTLGLPYMRSKAWAELAVERSRVPYSIVRPAAVLGAGDTIVTPGFATALRGSGLPLVAGASPTRRVSLTLTEGLTDDIVRLVAEGPIGLAVHSTHVEVPLRELAELFATELGLTCNFARISWHEALSKIGDPGFSWLVASARFGQHYSRERQSRILGRGPEPALRHAILAGLSGLQGGVQALSYH